MRKKIMFIVPSLRGGGAEKVMVTLLKQLDPKKFEVMLVLLTIEGKYVQDVPKDVKIYNLGTNRVRHSIFSLFKLIRNIKPEVVFSTQGHLNIGILALRPFIHKRTKIIVREANTVSEVIKYSSKPWVWSILYKLFYKKADAVICQSKYMMMDLEKNFYVPSSKLVQIYNPVDFNQISLLSVMDRSPFLHCQGSLNIVALGRLAEQKGFDRLIQSFPKLLEKKPEAKLWIIGDGDLRDELKQQRDLLGLSDKIEFIHFQSNPYRWLKNADLFVLSSYYEGLPNVLLEAIACNCPVVAVQHPGGTREIMEITKQNDRYINNLVWSESWFNRPQENTRILLYEEFNASKVIKKYENLFSMMK